ncbi:hypothetical protein VTK56DRAFT_5032 [Thermocarpiscus australiensis]
MSSRDRPTVRTRFLLIADTHGFGFLPDTRPLQPIDVVIHCGDITSDSKLAEFKDALQLLRDIDAPLKIIIPGNHDFTLDTPTFQQMCLKSRRRHNRDLMKRIYGDPGEARQLFDQARQDGIVYLEEGTHRLPLANGALLTVYASPYTPAFGSPGFQYDPRQGHHDFAIPQEGVVDVVVTHGPPRGVLDRSWMTGTRAGSPELFAAVARARPRLHCFGHIHEGWGAEMVTWRDDDDVLHVPAGTQDGHPSKDSSALLADLGSVLPLRGDPIDVVREKERQLGEYARGKCVRTSHCAGDALPLEPGRHTLFVNAAVLGTPVRPPWVVDIELPRAEGTGDGGPDQEERCTRAL